VQPPLYVDGTRCLAYQVDGVWKSAVLEGPIYTPQQLLPILKDALDIFSNSGDDPFIEFTVELDTFNRLKVSRTSNAVIKFYARKNTSEPNQLADTLGLIDNITLDSTRPYVIFPNGVDLARPSSYHIDINKDIQLETTTGARATFAVPIDVNSFEVINYKAREHVDQIVSFPDLTRVLAIKWTDNQGLNLVRHQNWSMLLEKV
jgi:hypothetical protein